MAALDFIAGLGGAYTAIDAGMRAAKERQQAEEDREFLKAQRGLVQQQQQRQLDEQKRADTLRQELAAIKPTEQYQDPLQLRNDEEGNPLPGVTPRMLERPRTRDAQLRDAASAFRRSGDVGRAFELEGAAEKEMFGRAARQFAQLKAGSANLSAAEVARQAQSIFDNDPFPMQVAAIREGANGSVEIDIRNRDTGSMQTWSAKNKAELLSGIEAYYSPDSFQALQRARAEAAAKAEEGRLGELYKPYTLRPGERREVLDPATNRTVLMGVGDVPANSELVMDANGNLTVRRVAAARPEDPNKAVDDALKFVAQNSTFKDLSPEQAARAQTLTRLFAAQRPVDPAMAAEAAILAAMKPTEVRTTFDDKTGKIVDAIAFRGGNFIVEDRGGVAKPRDVKQEVMTGIANEYVSTQIPQQDRSLFIAAAYNGEARAALDTKTRQAVLDVLRTRLGREPKPEELAPAQKAAVDATAPILDLIGNHLNAGEKLSGMLAGSGFSLVGGRVVRAPAGQAAQQGGVAAASGAPAAAVGSAIPADAAKRGREAEEERKRREADAAAEQRRREEEARQKRASDEEAVRGLTVDIVREMTPEDAARIYRNYSSIIRDARVREALELRMVRRPWAVGAGGASAGAAAAAAPAGAAGTAPPAAAQAAPAQSGAQAARPQFSPVQGATSLPAPAAAAAQPAAPAQAGISQGGPAPARRADYTPAPGAQAPQAGLGLTPPAAAAAQPAAAQATATSATQPAQPAQASAAAPTTPPRDWPRTAGPDGNLYRSPPQKIEIPSVAAMKDAVAGAARGGDLRAVGAAQSAIQRARDDFESYSREVLRFTLLPADAARVRSELARISSEISQAGESNAAAALRLRSGTGATNQARQGAAAGQPAAAPGRPAPATAQGGAPTQAPSRSGAGRGGPTLEQLADGRRRAKIESDIREKEELIQALNEYLATQRQRGNPDRMGVQSAQQDAAQAQRELLELRRQLAR